MNHRELQTIAALCASVALLIVGAVIISSGSLGSGQGPISFGVSSGSQTASFGCGLPGIGCGSITHFPSPPMYVWICDNYTDPNNPQCPNDSGNHIAQGHNTAAFWYLTGYATIPGQQRGDCSISGGQFGPIGLGQPVPNGFSLQGHPTVLQVIPNGQNVTYQLYCYEQYNTGYASGFKQITVSYCATGQTVDAAGQCSGAVNHPPSGYLDSVSSGGTTAQAAGWAYDPDSSGTSIAVHFYIDGTFAGSLNSTDVNRPDVNASLGITGTHGFNWTVPASYCNGVTHTLTPYAIDTGGGANPPLSNAPKSFSCAPTPSVLNLTPTPPSVAFNGQSTLSYAATGGSGYDACLLAGGQWGAGTPVGTAGSVQTNKLTTSTTYSYNCHDIVLGWQAWKTATVSVASPPPAPPTLSSSCPTGIISGGSCSVSWVCPPGSTGSFGSFPTGGTPSGSANVTPTQTTNYTVTCQPGNSSAGIQVTVNQPQLSITATPSRVRSGDRTTVSWTAANVSPNSCSVTKTGTGTVGSGLSGSINPTITQASEYTLSCSTPAASVSQSVTITPIPSEIEI